MAQERLAVATEAGDEVEAAGAVRISLSICLEHTQALWIVLSAAQGLMNKAAQRELARRVRQQIASCALAPRRAQSAPTREEMASHDHANLKIFTHRLRGYHDCLMALRLGPAPRATRSKKDRDDQ